MSGLAMKQIKNIGELATAFVLSACLLLSTPYIAKYYDISEHTSHNTLADLIDSKEASTFDDHVAKSIYATLFILTNQVFGGTTEFLYGKLEPLHEMLGASCHNECSAYELQLN